jgi:hypothetical protein
LKKPILSIDEPPLAAPPRADRPPTEGFVVVVDGHFKTELDSFDATKSRSLLR